MLPVYYCLSAQDASLGKEHLLSTAWSVTISWNVLVLAKTFAPFRHTVPCVPSPAQPFSAAVQKMPVLFSRQHFIQKFNAVWYGECCLGSFQAMAKWFTEVQTLFLPAVWTTCVCEYQLILLHRECVSSVGSCRTEAGCRDQVRLEGRSVHLVRVSQNQFQPPATCAEHRLQTFFPALEGEWCQWCCKSRDGKPGKSHWLSVAFLCLSSGDFSLLLALAYLICVISSSRINKRIALFLCFKCLFATSEQ